MKNHLLSALTLISFFILPANRGSGSLQEDSNSSIVVPLPPSEATIHGAPRFEKGDPDLIDNWRSRSDWIRWTPKFPKPGIYKVIMEYSVATAPSKVEVAVGEQGLQANLEFTDTWKNFCTHYLGEVQIQKAGTIPVRLSSIENTGLWIMNLRMIRFIRTDAQVLEDPPQRAIHPAL